MSQVRLYEEPAPAESVNANAASGEALSHFARRRQLLESAVDERIRTRLGQRVRNLHVRVEDDVVLIEGECATYYTKQLAQHAAMGVLEDEHLENAIVVRGGG
ncbi:MAG: BON domain-containing protein [Pirellulales bacterium]